MKFPSSLVSAPVVALAIGAIALGQARPAQAFGLSFGPVGFQDGTDTIDDLEVTPGAAVSFDVLFDGTGLDSTDLIQEIDVYMAFDSTELSSPNYPGATGIQPFHLNQPGINYTGLRYSGLSITGGTPSTTLGTISFASNPAGLPNNGEIDFSLLLTGVRGTRSGSTTSFFVAQPHSSVGALGKVIREIEVQGATAVPTPALLPGLAAFGMSLARKRKQELAG